MGAKVSVGENRGKRAEKIVAGGVWEREAGRFVLNEEGSLETFES